MSRVVRPIGSWTGKQEETSLEDEFLRVRGGGHPSQEPFLHVEHACVLGRDATLPRLGLRPGPARRLPDFSQECLQSCAERSEDVELPPA